MRRGGARPRADGQHDPRALALRPGEGGVKGVGPRHPLPAAATTQVGRDEELGDLRPRARVARLVDAAGAQEVSARGRRRCSLQAPGVHGVVSPSTSHSKVAPTSLLLRRTGTVREHHRLLRRLLVVEVGVDERDGRDGVLAPGRGWRARRRRRRRPPAPNGTSRRCRRHRRRGPRTCRPRRRSRRVRRTCAATCTRPSRAPASVRRACTRTRSGRHPRRCGRR